MLHCLGRIEHQAVCVAQTSRTPGDSKTPQQICNEKTKQSLIVCMRVEKDAVYTKFGRSTNTTFLISRGRHCRTRAEQVFCTCNWSLNIEVARSLVNILYNAFQTFEKTSNKLKILWQTWSERLVQFTPLMLPLTCHWLAILSQTNLQ